MKDQTNELTKTMGSNIDLTFNNPVLIMGSGLSMPYSVFIEWCA